MATYGDDTYGVGTYGTSPASSVVIESPVKVLIDGVWVTVSNIRVDLGSGFEDTLIQEM